jgi:hypothetical protein
MREFGGRREIDSSKDERSCGVTLLECGFEEGRMTGRDQILVGLRSRHGVSRTEAE